jgi:hypothetical protein
MRLRAYATHPDPATAVVCLIGMVLGTNGPFYPLYVIALTGWGQAGLAFLTTLATPFFLAIPMLARGAPETARVGLWLVGTVNTLWCMKLLGSASGVGLFFLPCIVVSVLLPRGWQRMTGIVVPLLLLLIPGQWFGPSIMALTSAQQMHLLVLNQFSAACLLGLLALQLGRLLDV